MPSSKQGAKPTVQEEIFAKGRLFELVHTKQPDGRIFETARRAPGVRLIIADKTNRKVLLTKEYRNELKAWDYRLPGGKVFDSLDEYEAFRLSGSDIELAACQKAAAESVEEAGIDAKDMQLFTISTLGATVEWDLFVFEVTDWQEAAGGQQLEVGEEIEADGWFDYSTVQQMIIGGEMQEERIALILLRWLHKQDQGAQS